MALKRTRGNGSKRSEDGEVVATRPRASQGQRGGPLMPPARPSIFNISPPVDDESGELGRHFLERCFYCHKRFDSNRDVFMSCGFAFCTEECRLRHLEMEGEEELADVLIKRPKNESENECETGYVTSPESSYNSC